MMILAGLFLCVFERLAASLDTIVNVSCVLLRNFLECVDDALFLTFLDGDSI